MNKYVQLFGILLITAFAIAGCQPQIEDSVDPAIFGGTWNGALTCNGLAPRQTTITIGMDGNNANLESQTGGGTCGKTTTYTGTLFNDRIEFKPQQATDACGNANSFSGSAYVHNNALILSESFSGPNWTTTCKFEGSK
ncbi:MAG: hypothetical protein K0Q79_2574 [Flavipsychrobacter sp.]|jgi:hypothetical protein|nr:hypothetical protein [Flavipsychrobacter sp.]